MADEPANIMLLSHFAKAQGWTPPYVTKLRHQGRLVLEGKRVRVAESLALIAATAGSRHDVQDRHAQERQMEAEALTAVRRDRGASEARSAAARADKEEMERDRMAGDLVPREDVDTAMKFIGATIRSLLDVFPDQVAPLVAPVSGLDECSAILSDNCRNVLAGLGEAIEKQQAELRKAKP